MGFYRALAQLELLHDLISGHLLVLIHLIYSSTLGWHLGEMLALEGEDVGCLNALSHGGRIHARHGSHHLLLGLTHESLMACIIDNHALRHHKE